MKLLRLFAVIPLVFSVALLLGAVSANNSNSPVFLLSIKDAVGPATDDYIKRGLEAAALRHAEVVIIQMDTPGGLDTSMRRIIQNIINSAVPVVTYVAPSGARAASAGTYILYASHVAAMAPGTNLGAATPVQLGGIPKMPDKDKSDKRDEEQEEDEEETTDDKPADDSDLDAMERKVINDAVAYIRGLAQMRGRNEDWAEKAVREAASLPANDALQINVIDIMANSLADLLQQLDGREVEIHGHLRQLHTAGAVVEEYAPDWRTEFLSIITNPSVAYILMLIGIYGLILEFSNPGAIVPGTIGGICLLLALFAFQLLPISYAGMGLILLGIALMVGEAFQPSFGILGIGGVVAFVFGSVILIDTEAPGFGIDLSVIVTFAMISALVFIVVVGMAIKSRRRPAVSGLEGMVGHEAVVLDSFDHEGRVQIHSEAWNAISDTPLQKGQQVKVTGMEGLVLKVVPVDETLKQE